MPCERTRADAVEFRNASLLWALTPTLNLQDSGTSRWQQFVACAKSPYDAVPGAGASQGDFAHPTKLVSHAPENGSPHPSTGITLTAALTRCWPDASTTPLTGATSA
jgi:hypothetical protein